MDRRSLAIAVGVFTAVFLLVALVEGVILSTRLRVTIPVATIVGAGFGIFAYLRSTAGNAD